jgi:hypothetical protein
MWPPLGSPRLFSSRTRAHTLPSRSTLMPPQVGGRSTPKRAANLRSRGVSRPVAARNSNASRTSETFGSRFHVPR